MSVPKIQQQVAIAFCRGRSRCSRLQHAVRQPESPRHKIARVVRLPVIVWTKNQIKLSEEWIMSGGFCTILKVQVNRDIRPIGVKQIVRDGMVEAEPMMIENNDGAIAEVNRRIVAKQVL